MPRRDGQPTEQEVAAQRAGRNVPPLAPGPTPAEAAAAALAATTAAARAARLPVAATVLAPPLTIAAVTTAAAGIIGAFDRFLAGRRTDQEQYVTTLLETETPDLPEDARLEVVDNELAAEKAWAAKARARLDHDLPVALSIPDRTLREEALTSILDRERRIMGQRETAMAARALGAAEQRHVEMISPDGGYWHLSEHVEKHDPECLAMAGKVWPHSVLRQYRPPVHPRCACQILSIDRALEDGLIGPASFATRDQAMLAMAVTEAAYDRGELAEEMGLLEVVQERWWKGTAGPGRFRRRHGDVGNGLRPARPPRVDPPGSAVDPPTPEDTADGTGHPEGAGDTAAEADPPEGATAGDAADGPDDTAHPTDGEADTAPDTEAPETEAADASEK